MDSSPGEVKSFTMNIMLLCRPGRCPLQSAYSPFPMGRLAPLILGPKTTLVRESNTREMDKQ